MIIRIEIIKSSSVLRIYAEYTPMIINILMYEITVAFELSIPSCIKFKFFYRVRTDNLPLYGNLIQNKFLTFKYFKYFSFKKYFYFNFFLKIPLLFYCCFNYVVVIIISNNLATFLKIISQYLQYSITFLKLFCTKLLKFNL